MASLYFYIARLEMKLKLNYFKGFINGKAARYFSDIGKSPNVTEAFENYLLMPSQNFMTLY